MAECDGCGTTGSDAANVAVELVDESLDGGFVGIAVVRQLQAQQGIFKLLGAYVQLTAVDVGSAIFPCIETLIAAYLVDHTYQHLLALQQGDANRIGRILVDEVGCAVERVDHPAEWGCGAFGCALFGDEVGLGQQFAQLVYDELLRALIDIRHIVVGMFTFHTVERELAALFTDIGTSLACYLAHGIG